MKVRKAIRNHLIRYQVEEMRQLASLDGVRAVACLWVLTFHCLWYPMSVLKEQKVTHFPSLPSGQPPSFIIHQCILLGFICWGGSSAAWFGGWKWGS